jgi:pimeloyl-ACP methyl ester carboxylesterase
MSNGFLLLHGKGSGPYYPDCAITPIKQRLEASGHLVDYVENSWALGKLYQQPFENSIDEVDQGIARLVRQGATRIHIVGHSLGANVAFFYATQFSNFTSIVALAPAHNTHMTKFNQWSLWSRNKAQALISAGNDDPADFVDVAMTEVYITQARPSAYFSYLNPAGNTVMTRNVRKFAQPVNLFVATGSKDLTQVDTATLIYAPARKTSASRLLHTDDAHIDIVGNTYPTWYQWCLDLAD